MTVFLKLLAHFVLRIDQGSSNPGPSAFRAFSGFTLAPVWQWRCMLIWYSLNQKLVKLIKYSSIAIIIQYNPFKCIESNINFSSSLEHWITFYLYQVIPDNRGLSLVKIEREAAK